MLCSFLGCVRPFKLTSLSFELAGSYGRPTTSFPKSDYDMDIYGGKYPDPYAVEFLSADCRHLTWSQWSNLTVQFSMFLNISSMLGSQDQKKYDAESR